MLDQIRNKYGVRKGDPAYDRVTKAWDRIQDFVSKNFQCLKSDKLADNVSNSCNTSMNTCVSA